ncbi:hypothetical protein PFDG_05238 [Plasmodium falciparum Dd2]|uniref:Beta-catenin-like protein 1 N-terminal domain-containing protein n=1 Tax=Plasmodium falciparum (isolate Dd2) TaxID=57267 RepID=A0A0L7MAQ7_PLAF4|nr:hypothetical protein PFDG_05238 [Plasmodium falciparum Dd2]
MNGLKYLFCLFMLRDIIRQTHMSVFECEETIIIIISNLSLFCTGTFEGRVLSIFGEEKM